MSYTTGSADSYQDLLLKIKALAVAAGWTTLADDSAGSYWVGQDAAGTGRFILRNITSDENINVHYYSQYGAAMMISGFTGTWDASKGFYNQTGQDFLNTRITQTRACLLHFSTYAGPFAKYYAFVGATYIHVVIEVVTGTFAHLFLGTLNKDGAVYDGGQYCAASYYYWSVTTDMDGATSNAQGNGINGMYMNYPFSSKYPYYAQSFLRVENVDDAGSPAWDYFFSTQGTDATYGQRTAYGLGFTLGYNQSYGDTNHPMAGLVGASNNALNSSTMLVPHSIYHQGAQARFRYVGLVPDHAVCNMAFLAAGDILTFGEEEWQVFPCYRKGTVLRDATLNIGYAFKIVR